MRRPSSRSLAAIAVTIALGEVAVAAPSAPRPPYDAPPPAAAAGTAPVVALAPPPSEAGLVLGEVALGFVAATTMTVGGLVLIANNHTIEGASSSASSSGSSAPS
jgi:hypothetical protein